MRKTSLERMEQIKKQERDLDIKKTLTVLKSAINDEMVKTARSYEGCGADDFLVLGMSEYKLLMRHMYNTVSINDIDMPFELGQPPCKLWGMDIIVLPAVESYIGVAVNKLEGELYPEWSETDG